MSTPIKAGTQGPFEFSVTPKQQTPTSGLAKLQGHEMATLKISDGLKTHFFVNAVKINDAGRSVLGKLIANTYNPAKYIQLKVGSEKVLVKISDLAKTLGISKSKVLLAKMKGAGEMEIYINKRALLSSSDVKSAYDTISSYLKLPVKNKYELLKTIHQGLKLTEDSHQNASYIKVQNRNFTLTQSRDQRFAAIALNARLGKGATGDVYDVSTIKSQEALKLSKVDDENSIEATSNEIKNEINTLNDLNNAWGLQEKPHKVVHISGKAGEVQQVGFIGVKYDGDLASLAESQASQEIDNQGLAFEFEQLLSGLDTFHEKEYLHGDIKLENMFYKMDEQGNRRVFLGDMGGVRKHETPKPTNPTRQYTIAKEFLAYTDRSMSKETLIQHEQRRDVFSLGVSLFRRCTGKFPYKIGSQKYLSPELTENELAHSLPENLHPELKKLILSMIDIDPTKRPTAKEAKEKMNEIINLPEFSAVKAQLASYPNR